MITKTGGKGNVSLQLEAGEVKRQAACETDTLHCAWRELKCVLTSTSCGHVLESDDFLVPVLKTCMFEVNFWAGMTLHTI